MLAASLVLVAPAQAQSAGYKFLEAVRKSDGAEVEKMLANLSKGTPGDILINSKDISTGDTALHIVIARRDLKWVSFMLYRGADVNLKNNKGNTPLWLAISTGFSDAVPELIAKGARVNDAGPAGETPLIAAVHQRNIELVRVLLKAGADPTRADNSGRTAKDYAELSERGSLISNELDAAIKAVKARKAATYGPSF
mgnify:CR=1 FL=1